MGLRESRRVRWWACGAAFLLVAGPGCGSSPDGSSSARAEAATSTSAASEDATHHHETPVVDFAAASSAPACPATPQPDPSFMEHDGPGHEGTDCRLDPTVQAELDRQLGEVQGVLDRLPTIEAAVAAGYQQSEGDPHLTNWSYMDDTFDIEHPEMLLVDGTADDEPVLAAVYHVVASDPVPPDGFVGTRDLWHAHTSVCVLPGRTTDGEQVRCEEQPAGSHCTVTMVRSGDTDGECGPAAPDRADGWMLHVWVSPALPNPMGVFAISHHEIETSG